MNSYTQHTSIPKLTRLSLQTIPQLKPDPLLYPALVVVTQGTLLNSLPTLPSDSSNPQSRRST
eukprot:1359451-Amorphochlora_amoeboformis.AAC.1